MEIPDVLKWVHFDSTERVSVYTIPRPTGITLCVLKRIICFVMKSAALNKKQYNVVGGRIYTCFPIRWQDFLPMRFAYHQRKEILVG